MKFYKTKRNLVNINAQAKQITFFENYSKLGCNLNPKLRRL